MRQTLTRPTEPAEERTQPRLITRIAVGLAIAKCLILTWLLSGPAQVPFSRAEVLFMFWTGGVLLVAAYLLCQDLMECRRSREALHAFRLGMRVGRIRR